MGKDKTPPPITLTQRLIAITVQFGVPEQDELVFNVHFTNNSTGAVWDVTYRFSQLATLDHDISMHSDKMKEIRFPQIDDSSMAKLISKVNYPGKLQDLDRYRLLMEDWIQSMVSRCHLMPLVLYDLVEDWFCLPLGPTSDWRPGRTLNQQDIDALTSMPSMPSQDYTGRRSSMGSVGIAGLNGGAPGGGTTTGAPSGALSGGRSAMRRASEFILRDLHLSDSHSTAGNSGPSKSNAKNVLAPSRALINSAHLPDPKVMLLKVRVQRGQRGRNGRVQYDIHIDHSPNRKAYIISRSYSVFRRLWEIIMRVHSMNTEGDNAASSGQVRHSNVAANGHGMPAVPPKTAFNQKGVISVVFPEPPFRSNFGLPLTEANLSYRTRQLDAWLRDVCCCYKYMQEMERAAVRYFLDLDMSKSLDIMIQDKLARGLVEAPRASVYVPAVLAIREKDPNEILETQSHQDGLGPLRTGMSRAGPGGGGPGGGRNPIKSSASDIGAATGKKQALWETSSLASSTLKSVTNATNIGRGNLFHGKLPNSALTQDRLDKLQSQLQQQQKAEPIGSNKFIAQVQNQYNVTNSISVAEKRSRMSSVPEGSGEDIVDGPDEDDDAFSESSEVGSEVDREQEVNDESLLHIGMDDKPKGKNRATTDQWVAREFTDSTAHCVIQ